MKKDLESHIVPRKKCYTCYRPGKFCVCEYLKPVTLNSKVVILIHPMEAKKEKLGTGRITKASLTNSEIIMGIDFTNDSRVNSLINDPQYIPMVLYPGEDALNITTAQESEVSHLKERTPLIFVIDGTWPCAKKMMTLSKNINTLPRISFSTDRISQFLIKHQPHKLALSTIESVHVLIQDLAKKGIEELNGDEDAMIETFKAMVKKQIEIATDPNTPSYRGKKMSKERKPMIREKKNRSFILK
ncbi:tRNA-uridine aminocarboxypropyltransferase [Bacteriovorax sp. DB6_IX]|uniref:tRNA-uridine aminocarboxypropyltransferase n=1 Tax=Bacteriovorax sp. DB6_IX TaxID=1353530 RepID=UPI00038A4112|nr:tRNA-uridine aminocarboxypropyltransferase [Bacteriovorax sp. DB6_IX]EQC51989.1 DTW domain protein [Bacteriovorax sp. DB6_IX]